MASGGHGQIALIITSLVATTKVKGVHLPLCTPVLFFYYLKANKQTKTLLCRFVCKSYRYQDVKLQTLWPLLSYSLRNVNCCPMWCWAHVGPYSSGFLSHTSEHIRSIPISTLLSFSPASQALPSKSYPSSRAEFKPLSLHKATLMLLGSHNLLLSSYLALRSCCVLLGLHCFYLVSSFSLCEGHFSSTKRGQQSWHIVGVH